jgi:hypothetical protein
MKSPNIYITGEEAEHLRRIYELYLSSHAAINLSLRLQKMEACRGIKQVVLHLKRLKMELLNQTGTPKGSFWGDFRSVLDLSKTGRRGLSAALAILNVYGRWEKASITELDFKDYKTSIEAPASISNTHVEINSSVLAESRRISQTVSFDSSFSRSSSKRVPNLKQVESATTDAEHYELFARECPNLLMRYQVLVDKVYSNPHGYFVGDLMDLSWDLTEDRVGKIVGLTKDRGLKTRFIANPHRMVQLVTSRLKTACSELLLHLEESSVFDQSKGVSMAQKWLMEGRKVYSIDLTSATDNFPLSVQVDVLKRLFPRLKTDINFWRDVSLSPWTTPYGQVTFARGQPMGVGPSFSAFTLCHILLIRSCGGTLDNFCVLGDDVIISDAAVAEKYLARLSDWSVPVSWSKTLVSSVYCQFAGREIDRFGPLPVFKGSPLNVREDPDGFIRQYGLKAFRLVPQKVRKIVEDLRCLPVFGHQPGPDYWDLISSGRLDPEYFDFMEVLPVVVEKQVEELSVFNKPMSILETCVYSGLPLVQRPERDALSIDHVNANIRDQPKYRLNQWIIDLYQKLDRSSISAEGIVKYPISVWKKTWRQIKDSLMH